ncbi:MAG: PEP/pyruvate-binding domain-containing protein [Acidimicrobiales bacterium]
MGTNGGLVRGDGRRGAEAQPPEGAAVLPIDHVTSLDPALAGAKAAALAHARRAGLPVLDGFIIPTTAVRPLLASASPALDAALRSAWHRLSHEGTRPVVVRSSSPVEDGHTSSMAGQFRSILDVRGWDALLAAVADVVASAGDAPMAVLVQPLLVPAWGGVLFGADPVTGRTDRLVVAAVPGGPDRLVSGAVAGVQLSLSPGGRVLDGADDAPQALLSHSTRRRLRHLARRVAGVFGGPQDIEWAMDARGHLTLLQARPITAVGEDVHASGPLLGPGPVAETFPAPFAPVEEDLWVPPLREGLRRALALTGVVSRRLLRSSPVVEVVGHRVAADLELLGVAPARRSLWTHLDPRPPARRLRAAWRVGRLRAGLPGLASDLLADVDADLREMPSPSELDVESRVRLLRRSRELLVSLHGYEVLAGQLLEAEQTTAAAVAIRTLARVRAESPSADDEDLVARYPVLLALVAPAVRAETALPPTPIRLPAAPEHDGAAGTREALRLRIRWVHELMARTAISLGEELVARGVLGDPAEVREWRFDELAAVLDGANVRPSVGSCDAGSPLPSAFRLTPDGVVVPAVARACDGRSGRGAGGGRGAGPVTFDRDGEVGGRVLVVATLDPDLAPVLPGLSGLVAETGSVLSHLAILAREYGVPTVVDLPDARDRFATGAWVVVDGSSGEVTAVGDEAWVA